MLFKIDISRAFRHIRIDPGDIDLLQHIQHNDAYIDASLTFGLALAFFQRCCNAIRHIMRQDLYFSPSLYLISRCLTQLSPFDLKGSDPFQISKLFPSLAAYWLFSPGQFLALSSHY